VQILLDWDKKASKKYVSKDISKEIHERAEPFIKWLRDAEEETSEEEEEDVEVRMLIYTSAISYK
jgi:translation initiation factor 5